MLIASRATAGKRPQCLDCGKPAYFIDLNASWRPACNCGAELVTLEQLELAIKWAENGLVKAKARLEQFKRHE